MNKSYVYITIFFLLASFATALAPVSSYPYFFDAHNYNVKIVVGSQAPSEHVLAATDVSSSIISVSHSQNVQSALAEEIDSYEQDMVVIGDPCTNKVSKFLFETDKCELTQKGDAIITLLESKSGYIFFMISGNTPEATRVAGKVLLHPEQYNLNDELICVWGTLNNPHAEPCETSTYIPSQTKSTSSSDSSTRTTSSSTSSPTTSSSAKSTFVKKDI